MTKKVTSQFSLFPQISRIIPAGSVIKSHLRNVIWALLAGGLLVLVAYNVYASYSQPALLKQLLADPESASLLAKVLSQTSDVKLEAYLNDSLRLKGKSHYSLLVNQQKSDQMAQVWRISQVLKNNPRFPDGHAYLAVLSYNLSDCQIAKESIDRAIKLDPNRPIFRRLAQTINSCRQ